MAIHEITEAEAFHTALKEHKVVVADFYAVWCGDCKMIDPFFNKYAAEDKYKDIYFVKIDVDKLNDLSKQCDVRRMPTFQLYKDGEKITQVAEPKPNDLTEFLAKAL
ncbi:hypothetical protein K4F52_009984 [Lecanicillium sp. MT-2017a]|nr:hypothetical protein K4F52_009984 [Lecanicillium sp. MT-2017a]